MGRVCQAEAHPKEHRSESGEELSLEFPFSFPPEPNEIQLSGFNLLLTMLS